MSHLYRAIANHQTPLISKVGLDTFIDPRQEGGRINKIKTNENIVKLIEIDNKEMFSIHILQK